MQDCHPARPAYRGHGARAARISGRATVCAAFFVAVLAFTAASTGPAHASSQNVKLLLDNVVAGIKKSPALGPFDKLGLKMRVNRILDSLGALHAGDTGQNLPSIRARYAAMLDGLVKKLRGKDPALITKVSETREPLWQALVTPAGYRLVAGEPKRKPEIASNR